MRVSYFGKSEVYMQNTPWWAALLLVMNVIALMMGAKLLRRPPAAAPAAAKAEPPVSPPAPAAPAPAIPDRQQLIAAVVASIAEYEGTDISSLRVVSFHQRREA